MSCSLGVKLKWLDHLNGSWVKEGGETVASREGITELYERLVVNQELVPLPQQVLHLKGPPLPDVDCEVLTPGEHEHYLSALLSSQLTLARAVYADSPFYGTLKKRLIVLHRIYHAITHKYHDQEKQHCLPHSDDKLSDSDANKNIIDR